MDNLTRLQYLHALGIDVWLPKVMPHVIESSAVIPFVAVQKDVETDTTAVKLIAEKNASLPLSGASAEITSGDNWALLQADVAACTRCGLCQTRTQTVFGSGQLTADWMIIGEAPGQHEDEQGLPFVGSAGLLLTEMLRAIGLARETVFVTNILKCRPPNNRDPKSEETESCHSYLQRQLALVQPKIILAVGRIAAQTLLQTDVPLSQLRGKVHALNNVPVIVVYHPAYLLRTPSEKRKAWVDLQLAVQTIKDIKG